MYYLRTKRYETYALQIYDLWSVKSSSRLDFLLQHWWKGEGSSIFIPFLKTSFTPNPSYTWYTILPISKKIYRSSIQNFLYLAQLTKMPFTSTITLTSFPLIPVGQSKPIHQLSGSPRSPPFYLQRLYSVEYPSSFIFNLSISILSPQKIFKNAKIIKFKYHHGSYHLPWPLY